MSFFDTVKRAIMGPKHLRSFVQLVELTTSRLGVQVVWDDDTANTCVIIVPHNGQQYYLCMSIAEARSLFLTMHSKIPAANLPSDTAKMLTQRSQELSCGDWRCGNDAFYVRSSMPLKGMYQNLGSVIATIVGEVAAFDESCYDRGYA